MSLNFDWRMQVLRHCRTREFSTKIISRDEAAVFEQFKRCKYGFSWFFESTNLSLEEMRDTYSERITSRVFSYYDAIRLIGDDIRIKKVMLNK